MNGRGQNPKQVPGPFRVGDRVTFLLGYETMEGVIVEDRGPIGVGGRRLYGVKVQMDPWNEVTTELPAEKIRLVARAEPSGKPRSQD